MIAVRMIEGQRQWIVFIIYTTYFLPLTNMNGCSPHISTGWSPSASASTTTNLPAYTGEPLMNFQKLSTTGSEV